MKFLNGILAAVLLATTSFAAYAQVDGNASASLPPAGTNGNVLTSNGATWLSQAPSSSGLTVNTTTITGGITNQLLYDSAGKVGEITKGNSCVYLTDGSGAPSCGTTLPSGLAATSMTLTTPSLGVAAGTSLALGGATIGANALAATGTANISGATTVGSIIVPNSYNVATPTFTSAGNLTSGFQFSGAGLYYSVASASKFSLGVNGTILTAGLSMGFAAGAADGGSNDTMFTRRSAAAMQLGDADAASPIAQTLAAQSVAAGASNIAGGNLTIQGSLSTGSGGGDVIISTTNSSAGATTQNTATAALTLKGGTHNAVFGGHLAVEGVTSTGATGTGKFVFDTAPTLGVTTVTSVNKWTLTAPTTAATLTAGGDNLTYTMPAASKTIMASDYSNASSTTIGSTTLTMGGANGALAGLTGLAIRDTSAAFDVTIAGVSSTALNAGRTLTLDMKNVAHTLAFNATANTITFPNTASFTVIGSADTGTVTNTMLAGSIASSKLLARANSQAQPGNPTAPNSTVAFKMQGLAGTITPTFSGNVLIVITGTAKSATTTAGDGILLQLATGTGTAPTSNAAATGNAVGAIIKYVNPNTVVIADAFTPITISAVVTGLTLSTAVWIDLLAESVATASSVGLVNVSVTAVEI